MSLMFDGNGAASPAASPASYTHAGIDLRACNYRQLIAALTAIRGGRLGCDPSRHPDLSSKDSLLRVTMREGLAMGDGPFGEILRDVLAGGRPAPAAAPAAAPAPAAVADPVAAAPAAAADPVAAAAAALAAALAASRPAAAPLDEAAVDRLIARALDGITAPRAVDIRVNSVPAGQLPAVRHTSAERVMRLALELCRARAGVYVLMTGPAGCGKSMIAEAVAAGLGLPFRGDVTCSPLDSMSRYVGRWIPGADGAMVLTDTPFARAVRDGGIVLIDEIDNGDPSVLVSVHGMLSSRRLIVERTDGTYEVVPMHADCIVIAAANTFGTGPSALYVGRNQLDAATLDRFVLVPVDYDRELEVSIDAENAKALHAMRERLASMGAAAPRRVLSTRMLARMRAVRAVDGCTAAEALRLICQGAGWTAQELAGGGL